MNDSAPTADRLDSIVAKLSLKAMNCQPVKGSLKADSAPVALARIFGIAKKYDVLTTTFGDSTRIIGDFEGINLKTGEVYKSTKCFLPPVISEIMVNALDAREEGDSALEFALEIGAQYSEKGGHGYAYTVKPLVKTQTRDALSHLREKATVGLPQLAAPEKGTETVVSPAPAKTAKK